MARYLHTAAITAGIVDLINNARSDLYIISPYLKLSDNIRDLLKNKEAEKVETRIIFGKQELSPDEMAFLQEQKYVRLYFSKNLHAKCYFNESQMIIASMNLYEFSQQHNKEMGVLIDAETDRQVYEDARRDLEGILRNSEDFSYVKAPESQPEKPEKPEKAERSKSGRTRAARSASTRSSPTGHCIRCEDSIPLNPAKPYCWDCYVDQRDDDEEWEEEFCHICGDENPSTLSKPACRPCYRQNRELF